MGKIWRPTARSPRGEAAVNAEFDLDCDWSEFEQKIAGLVQEIKARNHAQNPVEEEAWDEALLMLSEGDHYRSVLITTAGELHPVLHAFPPIGTPAVRPRRDRRTLWGTAFAVLIGPFALIGLYTWLIGH